MKTKDLMSISNVREVVIVRSNDQNKGKGILGLITDVFLGPDNTVRAVRVKTSKLYLECAVQHLHPFELHCDVDWDGVHRANGHLNTENDKLNHEETEFWPNRNTEAIAKLKTIDISQEKNRTPQVEWLKEIDYITDHKRFHEHIFNSYN